MLKGFPIKLVQFVAVIFSECVYYIWFQLFSYSVENDSEDCMQINEMAIEEKT